AGGGTRPSASADPAQRRPTLAAGARTHDRWRPRREPLASRRSSGNPHPEALLVVLVGWLTLIFASFGLFVPRNATAFTARFVCALSVAGSIFLISELAQPLRGLIQVSSAPMREALAMLGQPR